jgi:tetratricopeptide (TPR) repeat protein
VEGKSDMVVSKRIASGLAVLAIALVLSCQKVAPAKSMDAQTLFKRVSPSVFVVHVRGVDGSEGVGSGVAISPEEVLTNDHVVQSFTHRVWVNAGSKRWRAVLSYANPTRDLAILKVPGLKATPARILRRRQSQVGQTVYAIGAPAGLELTLSQGLISGLRKIEEMHDIKVIQTTAAISPGSSGGGLFDDSGRLVGVTTAYLRGSQNINFAIPAEYVLSAVSEHKKPCWQSYAVAAAMAQAGETDEAAEKLRAAVREAPGFAEGWAALGQVLTVRVGVDEALYAKARDALQQAVRLDPDLAEAWLALGRLSDYWSVMKGPGPASEAALRAALAYEHYTKLKPNNAEAWASLAYDYRTLKRARDAIDSAHEALGRDPGLVKAWLAMGDAYRASGQVAEAVGAYSQGTSVKTDSIPAVTMQAQMAKWLSNTYYSLRDSGAGRVYQQRYNELVAKLQLLQRRQGRNSDEADERRQEMREAAQLVQRLE